MDGIDEELICAVCLEYFEEPLFLHCGHNFCKKCIYRLIENGAGFMGFAQMGSPNNFKCPVCQRSFRYRKESMSLFPRNKTLENIINLRKSAAPVDIFDPGWNSDLQVKILQCPKHALPMHTFCTSCSLPACHNCEVEHHQGKDTKHQHKIFPIKDVAFKHQAEIAEALTEIKKRSINLNERLQLLKDLQQQVENNEKSLNAQLEHHVNTIMSAVRKQHEELKRRLQNDSAEVRKPVEDELRRCNSLKTSMQELMKKVSDIKRTVDTGLRISLMTGAKKQLNSLLCFDIAWSVKDNTVPVLTLPNWQLDVQHVLECIAGLNWSKQEMVSTLTDKETVTEVLTAKSPKPVHVETDTKAKDKVDAEVTDKTASLKDSSERTEEKNIHGATASITQTKLETTFGVNNDVTFDDKTGVRPKVKGDIKKPVRSNLSETVEMVGLCSETDTSLDGSIKIFTAETDTKVDNSLWKKGNRNSRSPSLIIGEHSPKDNADPYSSQMSEAGNKLEEKTISSTDDCISGLTPVTMSIGKVLSPVSIINKSSLASANKSTDATLQNIKTDAGGKNEVHKTQGASITSSYTAAKAKPKMKPVKTSGILLSNNTSCEQEHNKPKADNHSGGSELVTVSYPFTEDDDDDKEDQFLSQSLNRISFNPKKASRDEHRNSFPPDTVASKLTLKPKSQRVHKFEKPKQRSPHQDAVAKFVARRRTGSPHIPKTLSSQSLKTAPEKVEFPKTLSSPALSEFSVGGTTKSHFNGESPNSLPSGDSRSETISDQGLLHPEKSVALKFV